MLHVAWMSKISLWAKWGHCPNREQKTSNCCCLCVEATGKQGWNWVSEAFPVTCAKSYHLTWRCHIWLSGFPLILMDRGPALRTRQGSSLSTLWDGFKLFLHTAYRDLPLSSSSFTPSHLHSNKVIQQNDPDTSYGKHCGLVEITWTFVQRKLRVSESLNLLDINHIIMSK